jgi:hypothetical protein
LSHQCHIEGCQEFGCHGFGPMGSAVGAEFRRYWRAARKGQGIVMLGASCRLQERLGSVTKARGQDPGTDKMTQHRNNRQSTK